MTRKSKIRRAHAGVHPVAAAMARAQRAEFRQRVREAITADVAHLQGMAEMQAWMGEHRANLINTAGRLVFIVLGAAQRGGLTNDEPDVRIALGMGSALGDLGEDGRLDHHRPAIQSGLMAIERLLPRVDAMHMADAADELDRLLGMGTGMGTADLKNLFLTETTKESPPCSPA